MSRDAELCMLVHLVGADLDLDAALLRPDHSGVDRPVEVALGRGDVVVELAGNVRPQPVDDTQRRIALRNRVDDDADRANVEHLFEREVLPLHLPVDAVDVLRPPVDLRLDAPLLELRAQDARRPPRCSARGRRVAR